jgi:hypothetical protein
MNVAGYVTDIPLSSNRFYCIVRSLNQASAKATRRNAVVDCFRQCLPDFAEHSFDAELPIQWATVKVNNPHRSPSGLVTKDDFLAMALDGHPGAD